MICKKCKKVSIRYDSKLHLCDKCLMLPETVSKLIEYKTVKQIIYSDFNDLVMSTYKRPYNLQQHDYLGQNEVFNITVYSKDDYSLEDVEKMREEVEDWAKSKAPEDFFEEIDFIRKNYPDLDSILLDLSIKGFISPGEYEILVWW